MKQLNGKKPYLLFYLNEKLFATDINYVNRVVRMVEITAVPKANNSIVGVIDYHGDVIPIINIYERIGLDTPELKIDQQIIIVSNKEKMFGFIIEKVAGVFSNEKLNIIDSKKIIPGLDKIVSEVAKYNDEFVMIYEIEKLLTKAEMKFMNELNENKTK